MTPSSGAGVLVVTPTYEERDNVLAFAASVHAVLPEAHLLVVDDASGDGTGELAARLADRDARVFVLHRPAKLGLGTAYLEGFRWFLARDYEVLIQMDTDGSHDPGHLPAFLYALSRGADLVLGSRNIPGGAVIGWEPLRHLLSLGGSTYARCILGVKHSDLTSGYKAFRRATLQRLDLEQVRCHGYAFQIEVTYRALAAGARVVEVPIVFEDRRAGQSKMSHSIVLEAVIAVWWLRVQRAFESGRRSPHD